MSTQEFYAFKLTEYFSQELKECNSFGTEPAEISTRPDSVTVRNVTQNVDGTWSSNPVTIVNPVKTPLEIEEEDAAKREQVINDYVNLARPYDEQMYQYNLQVNSIKQQIIDAVNAAVSYGCSTSPSYQPSITRSNGLGYQINVSNEEVPSLEINGVAVGVGSAILQDVLNVKRYLNLENLSSDNIFSSSSTSLSSSNYGMGYATEIIDNSGSSLGTYRIISGYTTSAPLLPGGPVIITNDQNCVDYGNTVLSLANSITGIRELRGNYLSLVNSIKDDKTKEELTRWGDKQVKNSIDSRKTQIQSSVKNISGFVDPITMDSLVIYLDSGKSYGISTSTDNITGTNKVLSWNNISTDGNKAVPIVENPTYDPIDGQSVWFNQYYTSGKYLEFNKSYIDGDGSGINSGNVSFTLESWFKITSDSDLTSNIDTGGASIIGISSTKGIGLQVYKPSGIRINFGSRGNGSLENSSNLSLNTWYHVACVREVGVDNKIYINGVLDNSSNISNLSVISSDQNMRIGFCSSSYIRQVFPGKISIIRFYSRALNTTEVRSNYDAQKTRFV